MNAPTLTLTQRPKMIQCQRDVIAGPETAARLGVPVGTVIDTTVTRWYRNPIRRALWRLAHPRSGSINIEGSVS